MAADLEPTFTGALRADITLLARLLRREVMVSVSRPERFFDDFSIGVNDGTSLLATGPWPALADQAVRVCGYRLQGLADALEIFEGRYWALKSAVRTATGPTAIAELDREVLQLFYEAGADEPLPTLNTGAHVRVAGKADRPVWSLFLQNTVLRRLLGASDVAAGVGLFEGPRGQNLPHVVFMSPPNPLAPDGVTVARAVQQLRVQCLDPDVILLARRGMAIKAASAADLWRIYSTVCGRIDQETHTRLRKLPWLFQAPGALLDDSLSESAVQVLRECLGADLDIRFWPSSREGVLRKAMGSPDLLATVAAGFPDHRTACLGGMAPLYVALAPADTAPKIAQRIQQAWEQYRKQYSEATPVRGAGAVHRPAVILLSGLGVVTAVSHPDEARPAFAALIETLVAAEGARAFGGMKPVPVDEAVALLCSSLRYPIPGDLPSAEPVEPESPPDANALEDDEDEGTPVPPPKR
jgi:hypothetical protein